MAIERLARSVYEMMLARHPRARTTKRQREKGRRDAGASKPPVAQRAAAANADTSCSPGGSLQPAAATDGAESIGEVPTSRVARSALGWSLLSGFFCTGMGGAYVISTYKTFGEQQASGHVPCHTSPRLTPRCTHPHP